MVILMIVIIVKMITMITYLWIKIVESNNRGEETKPFFLMAHYKYNTAMYMCTHKLT